MAVVFRCRPVRGRSFNNPGALNFGRRREIVQWPTPILRATCVTAIPASSMPKARLRCSYVMLRFFPILEFTHLTMAF